VNFKNIHLMRFLCATFFECYRMRPRRTIRIIVKNSNKTAVTNARFSSLHGLPVGPVSPSTTPVPLRKPRARHERASAMCRRSGGLPSAARRRALRFGCVPLDASLRSPLHFPRSPTADRSQSMHNCN
jgi:hypothetical protein